MRSAETDRMARRRLGDDRVRREGALTHGDAFAEAIPFEGRATVQAFTPDDDFETPVQIET